MKALLKGYRFISAEEEEEIITMALTELAGMLPALM
jgi:hypothetical protein